MPPHDPICVLGAGLSGLSCALHLARAGADVHVHERAAAVGGIASTDRVDRFLFDRTGHWLHLRDPATRALVDELLPGELSEVERHARVLSHDTLVRYPFQANTWGLPPPVVRDCLLGFVEALRRQDAGQAAPRDFHEYILHHLGEGIARHFMVPYNTKMWGVHPREITAAWCSRFVPRPSLEEVVSGAVGCHADGLGYNACFLYPRRGGIGVLADALAAALPGGPTLAHPARRIDWRARRVEFDDGPRSYGRLVCTLPLPLLVRLLVDPPEEVAAAAGRLRWTTVAYVNYGCRGEVNRGHHWVYVPEERFPFYRVGSYSNVAPHLAPAGHGSLYVETSAAGPDVDWGALLPRIRAGLVEAGLLPSEDAIVVEDPRLIPVAYVVFDHACHEARAEVTGFLEEAGILPIGRYGAWTYGSMEDAMINGREAAAALAAATP